MLPHRGEGAQMHLLAGGGYGVGGFHLGVAAGVKKRADRAGQCRPAGQERQAGGKAFGVPDGKGHIAEFTAASGAPPR